MSRRARRSTVSAYRPPRDRREVLVAVACAAGVIVVTIALLFVLRPRDESPPSVPAPLPSDVTLPTDTSAPPPPESVPTETAPPDSTSAPAP